MTCTAETGRQAGCQIACERLAEWTETCGKHYEEIKAGIRAERIVDDFRVEMIRKTRKRRSK
jgi:hypothetical protein